jgi:hypothetical protein
MGRGERRPGHLQALGGFYIRWETPKKPMSARPDLLQRAENGAIKIDILFGDVELQQVGKLAHVFA